MIGWWSPLELVVLESSRAPICFLHDSVSVFWKLESLLLKTWTAYKDHTTHGLSHLSCQLTIKTTQCFYLSKLSPMTKIGHSMIGWSTNANVCTLPSFSTTPAGLQTRGVKNVSITRLGLSARRRDNVRASWRDAWPGTVSYVCTYSYLSHQLQQGANVFAFDLPGTNLSLHDASETKIMKRCCDSRFKNNNAFGSYKRLSTYRANGKRDWWKNSCVITTRPRRVVAWMGNVTHLSWFFSQYSDLNSQQKNA